MPSFDIGGLRNLSPEPQREKSHVLFHIGAQSIASAGTRGSAQQIPASQPYPTLKFVLAPSLHLPSEVSTHKQHSPSLCPPQSGQRKELWRQSLPVVSAFPPLARFTVTHSQEPAANHPVGHLVDTTSDGGTSESLSHYPV